VTIEQFLEQARQVFGTTVRRIDPAKSALRPWIPMRFYTPPEVPRLRASSVRRGK
jgi:hypothetical protein